MDKIDQLSVFFPAYNEEGNIEATVLNALAVLQDIAMQYEVIVVNDGSTDRTGTIAGRLAQENSNVIVKTHHENLGYGSALRTGLYNAKFDLIVFTDADGQFDFGEVKKLLALQDKADMVIGYRIKRMDPPIRLFYAWGWKMLIRLLFGLPVKDVDCAFKLIKRRVLDGIPPLESTRGGMISPELLIKAHKYGFSFIQVGVHHYPRKTGNPTGAQPKVVLTSFVELIKLWLKIHFSSQTLH